MPEYVKSKVISMTKRKKLNGKTIKLATSILLSMICEANSKIFDFLQFLITILEITYISIIKQFTSCSIKPSLKKVSKYENKFAKLQKEAAKFNLRTQLKTVKKKEFTLEEETNDHEVLNQIQLTHHI